MQTLVLERSVRVPGTGCPHENPYNGLKLIMNRKVNRKKKNKRNKKYNEYLLSPNKAFTCFHNPSITFLDPHLYVTLKYTQTFSNSVAAAAGSIQSMNLNSLFDPDRTGSGHQPYGFDQLAALYNRYRVLNTRYRVMFGSVGAVYHIVVTTTNGLLVSSISDQATYQTACETPYAIAHVMSTNGKELVISRKISLNQLNGVTRTEYLADDRFEAAVGSSPTEIMVLVIGTFNPTGSTVIPYYEVQMFFDVDFHDPISLGSS